MRTATITWVAKGSGMIEPNMATMLGFITTDALVPPPLLRRALKDVLPDRGTQEPPYSAQLTYTVARNDESVVSILFSYSIYTGGAHPNSMQTAFNFLMPDGARVFPVIDDRVIARMDGRFTRSRATKLASGARTVSGSVSRT